jgi:hypothetical protein
MVSNYVFSRDIVEKFTAAAGAKAGEISGIFDNGADTAKDAIQKMIDLLEGKENDSE